MDTSHLLSDARIGKVQLKVKDLERSLGFYRDLLGLRLVEQAGDMASLAAQEQGVPILLLTQIPHAQPKPQRSTGLYHVAIRLPNRLELARVFRRLAEQRWPFHGFSDHKVSEAIYLPDPDGNGLELYRDRPREEWPWRDGQVVMRTDPLDVEALLQEAAADPRPWTGIHADTDIGHVHLHVRDLDEAEAFYHGILGLAVTQRDYPGARFFAAAGYHHHVGTNIWAGVGAPPPPEDAVGLAWFSLVVPSPESVHAIRARAEAASIPGRSHPEGWALEDGSGNWVVVTAETAYDPRP